MDQGDCCSDEDSSGYIISLQNKVYERSSLQEMFADRNFLQTDEEDDWVTDIKFSFHQPSLGNVVCRNGPMCLYVAHKKGSKHQWSYEYCHSDPNSDSETQVDSPEINTVPPTEVIEVAEYIQVQCAPNTSKDKKVKPKPKAPKENRSRGRSSSSSSCSDKETRAISETIYDDLDHTSFNPEETIKFPQLSDKDSPDLRPSSIIEDFEQVDIEYTTETLPDFQEAQNLEIEMPLSSAVKRLSDKSDVIKNESKHSSFVRRAHSISSCSESNHSDEYQTIDSLNTFGNTGGEQDNTLNHLPEIKMEAAVEEAAKPIEVKNVEASINGKVEIGSLSGENATKKDSTKRKSTWERIKKKIRTRSKSKLDTDCVDNEMVHSTNSLPSNASHSSAGQSTVNIERDKNDTKKSKKRFKLPKLKVRKETYNLKLKHSTIPVNDKSKRDRLSRRSSSGTSCSDDHYRHDEDEEPVKIRKYKKKKEKIAEDKEKSSAPSPSSGLSETITKTSITRPNLPELYLNGEKFTKRSTSSHSTGSESTEHDDRELNMSDNNVNMFRFDSLVDAEPPENLAVKEEVIKCYTMPTRPRDFRFDSIVDNPYYTLDKNISPHSDLLIKTPLSVACQFPVDEVLSCEPADKFIIASDVVTLREGYVERSTQASIIYLTDNSWRVSGTQSLPARLTKSFCSFSFEPYLDCNFARTLPAGGVCTIVEHSMWRNVKARSTLENIDRNEDEASSGSSHTSSGKRSTSSSSSDKEEQEKDDTINHFSVVDCDNTFKSNGSSSSSPSQSFKPDVEENIEEDMNQPILPETKNEESNQSAIDAEINFEVEATAKSAEEESTEDDFEEKNKIDLGNSLMDPSCHFDMESTIENETSNTNNSEVQLMDVEQTTNSYSLETPCLSTLPREETDDSNSQQVSEPRSPIFEETN